MRRKGGGKFLRSVHVFLNSSRCLKQSRTNFQGLLGGGGQAGNAYFKNLHEWIKSKVRQRHL